MDGVVTEVAEVCFEVVYDLGVALGSVGPAPLVGIATELSQVIQPAQGTDEFNQPDPGNQFVAALFVVTDTSSTDTTSDDADNDAIVIGSDNQTYTADFDSVSECTNFNGGGYASTQAVVSRAAWSSRRLDRYRSNRGAGRFVNQVGTGGANG